MIILEYYGLSEINEVPQNEGHISGRHRILFEGTLTGQICDRVTK